MSSSEDFVALFSESDVGPDISSEVYEFLMNQLPFGHPAIDPMTPFGKGGIGAVLGISIIEAVYELTTTCCHLKPSRVNKSAVERIETVSDLVRLVNDACST